MLCCCAHKLQAMLHMFNVFQPLAGKFRFWIAEIIIAQGPCESSLYCCTIMRGFSPHFKLKVELACQSRTTTSQQNPPTSLCQKHKSLPKTGGVSGSSGLLLLHDVLRCNSQVPELGTEFYLGEFSKKCRAGLRTELTVLTVSQCLHNSDSLS